MKLRILKPTPTVPYMRTEKVEGKEVDVQGGRSYHPNDEVAVEIPDEIAVEWIKNGIAEDFSNPVAKKSKADKAEDGKKPKAL